MMAFYAQTVCIINMFLTLVRNLRLGDLVKRLQNGPKMTISEHHF